MAKALKVPTRNEKKYSRLLNLYQEKIFPTVKKKELDEYFVWKKDGESRAQSKRKQERSKVNATYD